MSEGARVERTTAVYHELPDDCFDLGLALRRENSNRARRRGKG